MLRLIGRFKELLAGLELTKDEAKQLLAAFTQELACVTRTPPKEQSHEG